MVLKNCVNQQGKVHHSRNGSNTVGFSRTKQTAEMKPNSNCKDLLGKTGAEATEDYSQP